jgi:hypothetical protein
LAEDGRAPKHAPEEHLILENRLFVGNLEFSGEAA